MDHISCYGSDLDLFSSPRAQVAAIQGKQAKNKGLTLEFGINIPLHLLFFFTFFQGLQSYSGLHRAYLIDVLWCQPIKLIQVVSTSEFHEY